MSDTRCHFNAANKKIIKQAMLVLHFHMDSF